jgi:hypothetical protein
MPSYGLWHRVALVRTDVSEDRIAFIIGMTRIGELGTTLAVTSNQRFTERVQEPHDVTSQKMAFFIIHHLPQIGFGTTYLDEFPKSD